MRAMLRPATQISRLLRTRHWSTRLEKGSSTSSSSSHTIPSSTPSSSSSSDAPTHTTIGKDAAIVLLSGGLDSATTLAIAISQGLRVTTLSFDYRQRHRHELAAAAVQSRTLGAIDHRVAIVDPSVFATSSLVDRTLSVPQLRSSREIVGRHTHTLCHVNDENEDDGNEDDDNNNYSDISNNNVIPNTYVPARNTLFLSYGLALAETIGAGRIFIGANAVDYSGYPDCRPAFLEAFQTVANVGTRAGVELGCAPKIIAPLLHWRKTEIIRTGLRLGVDFAYTHSCYDPGNNGQPCCKCDSCVLRAEAFAQLGFVVDPVVARFNQKT